MTLTTDNRNMSDMENMYLARIDALNKALLEANQTIELLRADVQYAESMLTAVMEQV